MRRTRSARGAGLRSARRHEVGRRKQVDPVRLVEIPGRASGDARVPVLPHDPLRARVDHDHAVVVVVVRGDQAVRPAHRERRLGEAVRPARGTERPGDRAATVHDHDPSGDGEARHEHLPVRQQLRIGRVRHRRADRPEQVPGRAEPVDPAADLGHEEAAVRERRVSVRARETARRVVHAAAAEHAHDALRPVDLDDAAVLDVGDGRDPRRQAIGVVGRVQVAGARARDAAVAVGPDPALGLQRELDERVVELLVRDHRAVAGREEGVVRAAQGGVLPDDLLRRRDDQRAVVVPVGDQDVARHDPRVDAREAERRDQQRLRTRRVPLRGTRSRGVRSTCALEWLEQPAARRASASPPTTLRMHHDPTLEVSPSERPQLAWTTRRLPSVARQRASKPNDCTLVTRPVAEQSARQELELERRRVEPVRLDQQVRADERPLPTAGGRCGRDERAGRALVPRDLPGHVASNARAFHGLGEKRSGPVDASTTATTPRPRQRGRAPRPGSARCGARARARRPQRGPRRPRPRRSPATRACCGPCRCRARAPSPRPRPRGSGSGPAARTRRAAGRGSGS